MAEPRELRAARDFFDFTLARRRYKILLSAGRATSHGHLKIIPKHSFALRGTYDFQALQIEGLCFEMGRAPSGLKLGRLCSEGGQCRPKKTKDLPIYEIITF